jgi:NADPH:quinone reductase
MRAAYYEAFGAPENVKIGERPDPVPDADHMLVRTQAAAVGIWDVALIGGSELFGQLPLPRIPGAEIAGTVEVGAGAFNTGDRVFSSLWLSGDDGGPDPKGGLAELAAASVHSTAVIPDRLDFPEAAGLVISAVTAYEGLVDRAQLQARETVLVTAASGGVGTAAVQLARDLGGRVVAVASERNHDYVRDLGAEVAIDYHDPRYVEQLQSAAPNGFDVLFEGTGSEVAGQEAVAKHASEGKLRMPIQAEFPLERAREALEQVGARHSVGRVVLRIGS